MSLPCVAESLYESTDDYEHLIEIADYDCIELHEMGENSDGYPITKYIFHDGSYILDVEDINWFRGE